MPAKARSMVRLLIAWDVKPGQETAFGEFIRKEFMPGLEKTGLNITDFWSTMVGRGPEFLFGAAADDLETMQQILAGKEWIALQEKLLKHVTLSSQKIVPLTNRFQL